MSQVYFATNRNVDTNARGGFGKHLPPDAAPIVNYGVATIAGGNLTAIVDGQPGRWTDAALDQITAGSQPILVSIHGFQYQFYEGLERAAYIAGAYEAAGAATNLIAYSWPSTGDLIEFLKPLDDAYLTDQAHAAASAPAIALFLEQMAALRERIGPDRRLILLAHSMGNFALAGALDAYCAQKPPPEAKIFDEIVLAAADERADSFGLPTESRFGQLAGFAKRIHVYFSKDDVVLDLISRLINGNRRLGDAGPRPALLGGGAVRLVDCSRVDITGLNPDVSHQYYYNAAEVVADIASVILGRAAPSIGPVVLLPA